MKFLRGNAHFGAEAEFEAVGKPRRRVYVHARGLDFPQEFFGYRSIYGDDRLAVTRGMGVDKRDRLFRAVHDFYGNFQREELGVEVLLRCGRNVGTDFPRTFVPDDFHPLR